MPDGTHLVHLDPAAVGIRRTASRPDAAFVTQLIAVRLDCPSQRARRRASPMTATRAYRSVAVDTGNDDGSPIFERVA